jgi:hypothetical protein
MCKNIDLIAVGVLLAGIAIFTQARQVVVFDLGKPIRLVRIVPERKVVIVPSCAPAPPLPFVRD